MSRNYLHIKEFDSEVLKLKEQGYAHQSLCIHTATLMP